MTQIEKCIVERLSHFNDARIVEGKRREKENRKLFATRNAMRRCKFGKLSYTESVLAIGIVLYIWESTIDVKSKLFTVRKCPQVS